jgi:KipI family sensor histidine kinase inhibitor
VIALRFVGDAALCLDVEGLAPLEANAVVHQLDTRLRAARLSGVRDIVPGMTTLTVHVDPLRADVAGIETLVAHLGAATGADASAEHLSGRHHEVPVRYGGAGGPDLDDVARATGLSTGEVVAAHSATAYRVCFLGFLPGFAYLGLVHESLRMPRRATPRTRVPAGSVAIADVFTGVYPAASPGGWHIVGRTGLPLFDITRPEPSRFRPGDIVHFVEA